MAKPANATIYRCSFCGKSDRQVYRLVAGSKGYICDACVKLYFENPTADTNTELKNDSDKNCSFCGKSAENVNWLVIGQDGCICDNCLKICVEVLENEDKYM